MKKNKWFNQEIKEVEAELQTNQEKGLSKEEVEKRQEKYGFNQLKAAKKKTLLQSMSELSAANYSQKSPEMAQIYDRLIAGRARRRILF